jgi:hypothetical protein
MRLNRSVTNAGGGSGSEGSVPGPRPDAPPRGGAVAADADQANVTLDGTRVLLVEQYGAVAS